MQVFGPKDPRHPSVGTPCPICGVPFRPNDMTALVEFESAEEGNPMPIKEEVHFACAASYGAEDNEE